MNIPHTRPGLANIMVFSLAFVAGAYFIFAAVQGDFGVFRRVQIEAEAQSLRAERDALTLALGEMQNRTYRLSDEFLDLDLLDQQARDVLGYIRADEIVIR